MIKAYTLIMVSILGLLCVFNVSFWQAIFCAIFGAAGVLYLTDAALTWVAAEPVGHPCFKLLLAGIMFTGLAILTLVI